MNQEYTPRVSVVVPNYNYARYLPRRMETILDQTFTDLEVILLDDASTDDSLRVMERYRKDPRVRIVVNPRNSGSPFAQWNRGVDLAAGEFIWIAEADDFAEPGFLEELVPLLEADSRLGLAYCQSRLADGAGDSRGSMLDYTQKWWPRRWAGSFRNHGPDEVARYLVHHCTIPNASAVLFRREAFRAAGGADPDFRLCGDWMTYVRILLDWDLAFIPRELNHFRVHDEAVRQRMVRDPRGVMERYRVLEAVLDHAAVSRLDRFRARESRMYLWVDLAESLGWGADHPGMKTISGVAARVDPFWRFRFRRKCILYRIRRRRGRRM